MMLSKGDHPTLGRDQRRLFHTVHKGQAVQGYFSEVLTEVNLLFRLVPRPLTTATIAMEMPAAINPYSMAVAPDWSCMKRVKSLLIGRTPCDAKSSHLGSP